MKIPDSRLRPGTTCVGVCLCVGVLILQALPWDLLAYPRLAQSRNAEQVNPPGQVSQSQGKVTSLTYGTLWNSSGWPRANNSLFQDNDRWSSLPKMRVYTFSGVERRVYRS